MQEIIISNSSPIIHLAKIDQLDLLRDFFGELLIPEAVYKDRLIYTIYESLHEVDISSFRGHYD